MPHPSSLLGAGALDCARGRARPRGGFVPEEQRGEQLGSEEQGKEAFVPRNEKETNKAQGIGEKGMGKDAGVHSGKPIANSQFTPNLKHLFWFVKGAGTAGQDFHKVAGFVKTQA
jgi:hypothetical protein